MDIQNFLNNGQNRFPLSANTLDFMQNQLLLLQGMASVFGNDYIVKLPTVSVPGLIVINGEILPLRFGSGNTSSHIAITIRKTDINANGLTFTQARTVRYAQGVNTNQGSECYPRSRFLEIRKQQPMPNNIGWTNCTIYQNRLVPSGDLASIRIAQRADGFGYIDGFFRLNIPALGNPGSWQEVKIATLPSNFKKPDYEVCCDVYETRSDVQRHAFLYRHESFKVKTNGDIVIGYSGGFVKEGNLWNFVAGSWDNLRVIK
jgi:hypothetical protein